ncbi:hypothetical protein LUZ60_013394 [Juncus effusus]|nr:hypothetical protein LUZ60_013394 [Juncus effusus]
MSIHGEGEDSDGEVFIDEQDIIQEIPIDEEELPDRDDDMESDDGAPEEPIPDDSIYSFNGHSDEVYAVACSPVDPSLVATGSKDEKGFLWKIGPPDSFLELQGHTDTVYSVAFNHDGKLLATGGYDGLVRIWDASTGTQKCNPLEASAKLEWIKWHPKGNVIIGGSEDASVYMWNVDNQMLLNSFFGHSDVVTCGDFTPDGKIICTGSDDKTLRVWNPRTAESIHEIGGYNYHTEGLTCLAISADSSVAITGSQDGSVRMVNLSNGRINPLGDHTSSVECIAISPSSGFVATGGMDMKLIIWELDRSSVRCICDHEEGVVCAAWLGRTKYVASGCIDGNVRIWDSLTGNCVRTFSGHSDAIQSVAISADLGFLVSVSMDGSARVFAISDLR